MNDGSDDCDVCSEGFRLSDDNKLCLPLIDNCHLYEPSSASNAQNKCLKCNDSYGYSVASNLCEIPTTGAVENCAQYSNDTSNCISCIEGYYKDSTDNICLKHNSIWDCKEYSGDTANSCTNCIFGFLKLDIDIQCLSGIKIPNCVENKSYSLCEICEEGFFGENCDPIPYAMKCLRVDPLDSSTCVKCFPNYFLQAGNCVPVTFIESSHCQEFGVHSCKICRPFAFLYGVNNYKVCQPRNTISNLTTPNCLEYDVGNSKCLKCDKNYYIDNNSCQKFCPSARPSLIIHEYKLINGSLVLYSYNKCVDPSTLGNTGCLIFVPSSLNPTELICAKCKSGTISTLDFSNLSHHMYMIGGSYSENTSLNNGGVFEINDSLTKPGLTCSSVTSIDPLNNCEYWSVINSKIRCVKCQYRFKGEIGIDSGVSYISNCVFHEKCSRNTFPSNSGLDSNYQFQNSFPKSIPEALISCYFCINSTEIPFLYAKNTASGLVLQNYSHTNTPTLESATSSEGDLDYNNECINTSTFNFYNDTGTVTGFPSNCGYGLIDPTQTISTSGTSDYLQCLMCKPLYKASFTGNKISACDLISGCEVSWEFGRCSLCKIGYVWEYDNSDKFINKSVCLEFNDR